MSVQISLCECMKSLWEHDLLCEVMTLIGMLSIEYFCVLIIVCCLWVRK